VEQFAPYRSGEARILFRFLLYDPYVELLHFAVQKKGGDIHIFREHFSLVIAEMRDHSSRSPGSASILGLRPSFILEQIRKQAPPSGYFHEEVLLPVLNIIFDYITWKEHFEDGGDGFGSYSKILR
jgi:hypothetical protein